MANGCRFRRKALSAASSHLPLGAWVRLRNRRNGAMLTLRITDHGPFVRGRLIDVSEAAAKRLGMIKNGLAPVTIEILSVKPFHC